MKTVFDSRERAFIETVASQLATVDHREGGSFITTPLLYPSGTAAIVRVEPTGADFFVTDMGLGYREADMMGASLTYSRHARQVAEHAGVGFDQHSFFVVRASRGDLLGCIIAVANCSLEAVTIAALKISERRVADEAEILYERLTRVFTPSKVAKNAEIRGASNTSWPVANLVRIGPAETIFEPVLNHKNSIASVVTKFHDIALVERAPGRVAVVRNKNDFGTLLGVLTQAGRVKFQMAKHKQRGAQSWGYCRVSTDDQVKGESLDVQRSRVEAICAAERLTLAGIFVEEGVSGSKPLASRPDGSKLLEAAKRGDTIIALKLDRVFRNTSDALDTVASLNARGVKLYLADMRGYIAGDAAGELHFSMLASFATFERKRIAERICEAKRSLKARGVYSGGDAPFGYRKVPSPTGEMTRHGAQLHYLEPIPELIDTARDLLAKGYSSRQAAGHFAQQGCRVTHHAVNALFKRLRSVPI